MQNERPGLTSASASSNVGTGYVTFPPRILRFEQQRLLRKLCYVRGMQPLKAKVVNGHYVIEEKADLPEGTELLLVPAEHDGVDLSPEDRAEVERMVEEGVEDYDNGAYENARALGQRLLARS